LGDRAVIEEKIRIKCTKCSSVFRERGSRIKNGFQANCPQCNRLITFDSSSEDVNVRKAFQAAKLLRIAMESEASRPSDAPALERR
jgi:predicted  nucleic acid-binding Zn-ribbon protein